MAKVRDGPWKLSLDQELKDSRQQKDDDPYRLQVLLLETKVTVQFVKFELISWHGRGGGLQYFTVIPESGKLLFVHNIIKKSLLLDCSEIIKLTAKPRFKKNFSGVYYFLEIKNGKPAYKHENKDFYLFFKGWWKIDSLAWYSKPVGTSNGFISSNDNAVCPDKVKAGSWKYLGEAKRDEGISISQGY